MTTDTETVTKPPCVHGAPEWWRLWNEYRQGLGRASFLIDRMQRAELVHGKGLEREEGYDECLAMLAEPEARLLRARDARQAMAELGKPRQMQEGQP
jgi:hypothetical protein